MTITAELANSQVYVLSSAWLHGEANHNAEEGTVDLEFHGEEGLPVMKELEVKETDYCSWRDTLRTGFDEPTGKRCPRAGVSLPDESG